MRHYWPADDESVTLNSFFLAPLSSLSPSVAVPYMMSPSIHLFLHFSFTLHVLPPVYVILCVLSVLCSDV